MKHPHLSLTCDASLPPQAKALRSLVAPIDRFNAMMLEPMVARSSASHTAKDEAASFLRAGFPKLLNAPTPHAGYSRNSARKPSHELVAIPPVRK